MLSIFLSFSILGTRASQIPASLVLHEISLSTFGLSDRLIELGSRPNWPSIPLLPYQAGPAPCYPRSSPFGNTLHDPQILAICPRPAKNRCASTAKTNLPQNSRDRQGQISLQPLTALQCQGDRPFIGPPDVNEISLTWANSHRLLCPLSIILYASPRALMCNESHGTIVTVRNDWR